MRYKRFYQICLPILFFALFVVGCGKTNNLDIVTVYDGNENELYIATDREYLDYFAELIANSTTNIDDGDVLIGAVPEDAEISYHYVCSTTANDRLNTDLYVYGNYPYITLSGSMVKTPITWELSEDEQMKLQNPGDWMN